MLGCCVSFSRNRATLDGGAVYSFLTSSVAITRVIFLGNSAGRFGCNFVSVFHVLTPGSAAVHSDDLTICIFSPLTLCTFPKLCMLLLLPSHFFDRNQEKN